MGLGHVILWIVLRFFFLFVLAVVALAIPISPAQADESSSFLCEYHQSTDPFSLEMCERAERTPRKGWKKSHRLYSGENGERIKTGPMHGLNWGVWFKMPLWSPDRRVFVERP